MKSTRALAILSFNRPDYLAETLLSLRLSLDFVGLPMDVYLFQDGEFNLNSHVNRCTNAEVDRCIGVFRSLFPDGTVMRSPVNLGIALNMYRAENFLLEQRDYTSALFFEDDMVVHEYYVQVIHHMLDQAEQDDRIGTVACYGGDRFCPSDSQVSERNHLTLLTHNWGFGVTRRFYAKRNRLDRSYVDVIRCVDYVEKDTLAPRIHDLHLELGFRPGIISQDVFKGMATLRAGGLRFNTVAALGRYIGARGVHFTPAHFKAAGYDRTVLYPANAPVPKPDLSGLDYETELGRQCENVNGMVPFETHEEASPPEVRRDFSRAASISIN